MILCDQNLRCCDHADCALAGEFPAPKSRQNLRDYYWFCLAHVRDYNKKWDYYAGMNPEEIELEIMSDVTWNRPSWEFGMGPGYASDAARYVHETEQNNPSHDAKNGHKRAGGAAKFTDPFDLFRQGEKPKSNSHYDRANRDNDGRKNRADQTHEKNQAVMRALAVFALAPPFTEPALKSRFKQLVKIHHPDANLGDKEAEERLKQVIADYHLLRRVYHQADSDNVR